MSTDIFVVETNDDVLLGMVEFVHGGILIRSGFAGHPHFVESTDLVSLLPAEDHPFVEYIKVG